MKLMTMTICLLALLLGSGNAWAAPGASPRQETLLSGAPWQFIGVGDGAELPAIGTQAFDSATWTTVTVPHVFQTRAHYNDITQGWYRRTVTVPPALAGKRAYLVFEGAAAIADVYVNGTHLGQHRGAYTRFVFDATDALRPGAGNTLAVKVDDSPADTADCLPSGTRLYKVWGGLYRKVWLVSTDTLHIDPTDYASPGVYLTPSNIRVGLADLTVKVLLRNMAKTAVQGEVRATVLDPTGATAKVFPSKMSIPAGQKASVEMGGNVSNPKLWTPETPNLYHVRVDILRGGKVVDSVTQPLGFRTLVFAGGKVTLNGKPILLRGVDLHQEIESKASAMGDSDFAANYAILQDVGINWLRLPHYPHAQIEYDLCDRAGILVWAENGHSNNERPSPTGVQITTEMVKQNYNHPSIAVWSVGNEASADAAEAYIPVVKALDTSRPAAVANMACANADFRTAHIYNGWYGTKDMWTFPASGYVTETGAGGVVTTHCDYADAKHTTDRYEPEEYQQLVAEARFQMGIKENNGDLGMFTWWAMRDFSDNKYKKPIGENTKGLLTYAGDKKDVYYLLRCFLRPAEPTVHITSKRYFLRTGSAANGIKAYSSAAHLTLTLNGETVSTLTNGAYAHANGHHVDNVFYWPAPMRTGKNTVRVTDNAGHYDTATVYFYGAGGLPALPESAPLVQKLASSNPANPAYYMDMPVQPQWPIFSDMDGTADNSTDALPAAVQGATWIAARRWTKTGQEADITWTLSRHATVYVMCSQKDTAPAFLTSAGFTEVPSPGLVWRANNLLLVPAQLYALKAKAGASIHIAAPDRDTLIMLKE